MPDIANAIELFVIIQLRTNCLQLKHWQPVSAIVWRTTEERSKKICCAAERHLTKKKKKQPLRIWIQELLSSTIQA